ncbi:MAG: hypothetical protein ACJ780_24360 [Solirubrobacteraceae bacterium]|jgi:transposase InsO family protein
MPAHTRNSRQVPLGAGTARGVAVRHDHGSAFMAEHFRNQVRFWGMAPSYAFVAEPETDGVAERFFRTLKEQVVHGPSTGPSGTSAPQSAPSSTATTPHG